MIVLLTIFYFIAFNSVVSPALNTTIAPLYKICSTLLIISTLQLIAWAVSHEWFISSVIRSKWTKLLNVSYCMAIGDIFSSSLNAVKRINGWLNKFVQTRADLESVIGVWYVLYVMSCIICGHLPLPTHSPCILLA